MGSLGNADQFAGTRAAVATEHGERASIVSRGGRLAGGAFAKSFWHPATVLSDVARSMRIMDDETFGPVTPIPRIGLLEQAVEVADDSRHWLSAYIFSRDLPGRNVRGRRAAIRRDPINRTLGESVHAQNSGGNSGTGDEDGKWGVLRSTQITTDFQITKSAEPTSETQLLALHATGSRRAPAHRGARGARADRTTYPRLSRGDSRRPVWTTAL